MAVGTQTKKVNATLEASNLYWGRGQCRSVQFVADVAGSLSGEYWDLNVIDTDGSEKEYYVLLDNGSAVDPAPAGKTKIAVVYTNNDTAATIAGLFNTALASVEVFSSIATDTVTYENWYPGPITTEVTANAPSLTFQLALQVGTGGFLGATSEAITLAFEVNTTEITADQFGGTLLDEIIQGISATVAASLLEMTTARWESIIGASTGDIVTGSSSDVTGFGENKLFSNFTDLDGRLILHPKRLAGSDRSADWIMWKSVPVPGESNFSGVDPQTLGVEFRAYLDSRIDTKVNLVARGDWTQQSDLYV